MQTAYSLHKINTTSRFSFNADAYSRFKFGDDVVAEAFGTALARGFIQEHLSAAKIIGQIVVVSSPYSFIPTATFALKNYFVYELNKWLTGHELAAVQETKIHRTISYKEDYGELNAEERINLIGNDIFHIDKEFLKDKTIIFLDDIKITGSHERMITKMIREFGLINNIYLLYFAELVNKDIHPNIENTLNYHQVKSIFDLEAIIKQPRFAINTRIVKYVLNTAPEVFDKFIQKQNNHFTHLLYNMALGNSYHLIDAYRNNMDTLKKMLTGKEEMKMHQLELAPTSD